MGMVIIAAINVLMHSHTSIFGVCLYAALATLLCYIFDSRRNLMDCIVFHIAYNATIVCHALLRGV